MQPKFELTARDVDFTHMNTRTEKHGEEDVLAVDLDLSLSTSNEALAMLHSTLRWSLYDKPDVANSDLADRAKADELVRLRYPKLDALRWNHDMMNCTVTFHYGLGGKRDLVLTDCKVNRFRVTAHDGGTVDLAWRVQANPTHEQIGRLSERLSMGTVSVSIIPPEIEVEASSPSPAATNTPEPNPLDRAAAEEEEGDDPRPSPKGRGRRSRAPIEAE